MAESIPIPLDLLAETRQALDAAALLLRAHPAATQIEKARAKLDEVVGEKSLEATKKSDTIQRRSELKKVRDELLTLARRLEKVEKAA